MFIGFSVWEWIVWLNPYDRHDRNLLHRRWLWLRLPLGLFCGSLFDWRRALTEVLIHFYEIIELFVEAYLIKLILGLLFVNLFWWKKLSILTQLSFNNANKDPLDLASLTVFGIRNYPTLTETLSIIKRDTFSYYFRMIYTYIYVPNF